MQAPQPLPHRGQPTLVLRNDAAVFPWLIIGLFDIGVILMTVLTVRDGLPATPHPLFSLGMVIFFWTGAIGSSLWALQRQRIRVEINPEGSRLIKMGLFGKATVYFNRLDVERIEVIEGTDSDGDPYFYCELVIRQTEAVRIAEGHSQATVAQAARKLREALGLPNRKPLH